MINKQKVAGILIGSGLSNDLYPVDRDLLVRFAQLVYRQAVHDASLQVVESAASGSHYDSLEMIHKNILELGV